MPPISQEKKEKISEHILSLLLDKFPRPLFTSQIAQEIARDEEFTKFLLKQLDKQKLIVPINKNPKGVEYLRRTRWRLSNQAHKTYSNNPQ